MKLVSVGLALVVGSALAAHAAELLKSGPQVGDTLGAFTVVKAAGAPHDGVAVGEELCYRCRMGNRPMVLIFAHKSDAALTDLVKQVDAVVAKNENRKMGSFVSLLGDKPDDLKAAATKLVSDSGADHVAVVVPQEQPNGPASYNLSSDAEVTVIIYRQGTVVANHALAAGSLNDEAIKSIVADTSKILE
jgi:hypothetical protein